MSDFQIWLLFSVEAYCTARHIQLLSPQLEKLMAVKRVDICRSTWWWLWRSIYIGQKKPREERQWNEEGKKPVADESILTGNACHPPRTLYQMTPKTTQLTGRTQTHDGWNASSCDLDENRKLLRPKKERKKKTTIQTHREELSIRHQSIRYDAAGRISRETKWPALVLLSVAYIDQNVSLWASAFSIGNLGWLAQFPRH